MKRYIQGMALPRSKALAKLEAISDELSNHIIKCVLYDDILPTYMNHWVEEIAGFLYIANRTHAKSNFKSKDYMNSIFSAFGEDADDAYVNIGVFLAQHNTYPDVVIDDRLADKLANTYVRITKVSMPILLSSKLCSINEWIHVVEPILKLK